LECLLAARRLENSRFALEKVAFYSTHPHLGRANHMFDALSAELLADAGDPSVVEDVRQGHFERAISTLKASQDAIRRDFDSICNIFADGVKRYEYLLGGYLKRFDLKAGSCAHFSELLARYLADLELGYEVNLHRWKTMQKPEAKAETKSEGDIFSKIREMIARGGSEKAQLEDLVRSQKSPRRLVEGTEKENSFSTSPSKKKARGAGTEGSDTE
jgi:hypothetical protein